MQILDEDIQDDEIGILRFPDLRNGSDVPTNKEQIEEINRHLETIDIALGLRPKVKSWWARKWEWTRTHKTTIIPLIALILIIPG